MPKLDLSKLNFTDEILSYDEAMKDEEPWDDSEKSLDIVSDN